jgi:hypothetical protein
MDKKKRYEPDDPEQSERFIELAKEVGADESKEPFKAAMKRIAKAKRKKTEQDKN